MPVEIRELVIRAVTTSEPEDDSDEAPSSRQSQGTLEGQEDIVQECVRQVLRILQKEKER